MAAKEDYLCPKMPPVDPARREQARRAVKVTLGPKGRNVVIDKKFGAPTITKDGVTVAKEIELEGPLREHGRADGARKCASKTSDIAGDGTTTATVLAQAIFREGLQERHRRREPDGAQARHREGRRERSSRSSRRWPSRSQDKKEIAQVATISANNDERSASSSPTRWRRSARTASSPSKKARPSRPTLEVVEGMQFDRGLSLAVLRDRRREDGVRPRGSPTS